MHAALASNSLGLILIQASCQPNRVETLLKRRYEFMHKCSTDDLLPSVAFMHHSDKGHTKSNQYAALKALSSLETY